MGQKWSKEKAWEWYNSRPWIRGFNYISCGAVNRIEQWQEFEHDRIEECFRVELKLAHETGFNAVRSILPYEVWGRQHDSFMKYLETAEQRGDQDHGKRGEPQTELEFRQILE